MRILVACATFPPSRTGYARVAANLVTEFRKAGHEVGVLSEPGGCEHIGRAHRLTMEGRKLLQDRWDIVQVVGPSPFFTEQVVNVAHRISVPCVYKIDAFPGLSTYYPGWLPRLVDRIYVRTAFARATRLADQGVYSTRDFAEWARPRPRLWSVIPLGVEDPCLTVPASFASTPSNDRRLRLLFVGQLRAYKGIGFLLDATRLLRDGGTDFELTVVGDGPLRPDLEAQAARLGIQSGVRFRGALDDQQLHQEYLRNDVLVLPSLGAESYGLVLVEARLHGLEVISSDLPGPREVARELGGAVVPPADSPALARVLEGLTRTDRGPRQFEANVAASHNWSTIAQRYLDLYRDILVAKEQHH
jgi:glycosyltransferase involved in cell wall biosynthesis